MLSTLDAKPHGHRLIETSSVSCSCCGLQEAKIVARARDYIYHGSDYYLTHVACNACGHVYLNPRPTLAAISVMYPSNYGTFSSKFRGAGNLLALIKNAVNVKRFKSSVGELASGMRVLDVGCGNGEMLRALAAERPDLKFCGLDWYFPPDTRRDLEAVGIELIEGPLENADLPTSLFDCIVMYQLIEHLWEPEHALQKLQMALKPGGTLVIETPDTDGYDRRFFSRGAWGGYYVPRHLNLYNFRRLADALSRAQMEIVLQRSLPAPVIWCYSFQAFVQERFGAKTRLSGFFDLRNVVILAVFAAIDMLAISFGLKSSNQQAVARKRSL